MENILMKKRRMMELGLILIFIFAGSFLFPKYSQAASADVVISADNVDITVGDNIFVYVKVNSGTSFGDFEANLTYDDSILEYAGGPSAVKGSSGFLKISDMNVLDGDKSRKYTLKFQALKVGVCDIQFSGAVMVYDSNTGYEMSVSSNKLTLNVKAQSTASTDAKLKDLKTSPVDITPAFSPEVQEYKANVSYDTKQLIITAIPEDAKATVAISGDDSLAEGDNKVIISVLAESGDVIEYTINVFRDSKPTDEATGSEEISPVPAQSTFEVITVNGERYAIYSGRYQILVPDSSVAIPQGYKPATLILSDTEINAYAPVNNEESNFLLIYAKNEFGETGFYQYDRIERTLQRYNTEAAAIGTPTDSDSSQEADMIKENNEKLKKAIIVIVVLGIVSGLLILTTIGLLLKLRRDKRDRR
jgi:hypothetical protein